jgi:hypothetical protein
MALFSQYSKFFLKSSLREKIEEKPKLKFLILILYKSNKVIV